MRINSIEGWKTQGSWTCLTSDATVMRTPRFPQLPTGYTQPLHTRHAERGNTKTTESFRLSFVSWNGENWNKDLFNPPISLASVITKVQIFCLFVPQEPAVLQIYSYLILMSLNLCILFKVLLLYWIKHSSHFLHQLARKSKSFIFQENYQQENYHMVLSTWSSAHGPQVKEEAHWYLQTHVKAPNPPFCSCEG